MKKTRSGLLAAALLPMTAAADVVITPADGTGFDGFLREVSSGTSYNGDFVNDPGSRDYNYVRRYSDASNARHFISVVKYDLSAAGVTADDIIGAHLTQQVYNLTKGSSSWSLGIYTGNDADLTSAMRYDAANPLIADDYVGEGDPDLDFADGAVMKLLEFTNSTTNGTDDIIGADDPGFLDAVKAALDPAGDQAITFIIYYEGAGNSAEYLFVSSEAATGGPRLTLQTPPEPFLAVTPEVTFPGENLDFTWYVPAGSTNISISPEIGDVTSSTAETGVGSLSFPAPSATTTYTLSYDFEGNTLTQMTDVEILDSYFESVTVSNNNAPYSFEPDLQLGSTAYSDRAFTWAELPDVLLGGQALILGADDRTNANFQIDLSTTSASTLFLLIDNRAGDPNNNKDDTPTIGGGVMDWVVDAGFVDSGLEARVDETGDGIGNTPYSLFFRQLGPGESLSLFEQNDGGSRTMYFPVVVSPPVMPDGFGVMPNVVREFSSTTFSWAVPPGSTVSISPEIGDVTTETDAITGVGSIEFAPIGFGSIVYTLTYDPPGAETPAVDLGPITLTVEELVFDFTVTPEQARVGEDLTFNWQIPPGSTNILLSNEETATLIADVGSNTDPETGIGSITIEAPGEDTEFSIAFTYDGDEDFLYTFFTLNAEPVLFENIVSANTVSINGDPMEDGGTVYRDRTFTWVDVPDELDRAQLLLFNNDDKNNGSFAVQADAVEDSTIFLMIDNRVGDDTGGRDNPPTLGGGIMDWVLAQGFADTGLDTEINEGTTFSIFFKQVSEGETMNFYQQADGNSRILYNVAAVSPQVEFPTLFSASPSVIDLGQEVTLSWAFPAGSDIIIDQEVGDVSDQSDPESGEGSVTDTPTISGNFVYTLSALPDPFEPPVVVRAYVTVNSTGETGSDIVIGDFTVGDPVNGPISFSWQAPEGVTDPGALTDTVERSTTLVGDWETITEGMTITDGVVQFTDPSPPAGGRVFYRINRP